MNNYRYKVGDRVLVNEKFAGAIDHWDWPRRGRDLIGTPVEITEYRDRSTYGGPSYYMGDKLWFIPEYCLSPIVVEEYV